MAFYMIGIGLCDKEDITVKGLAAIKGCSKVYLEHYTSVLASKVEELEKYYGKEIILADRHMVESGAGNIIDDAKDDDIAFLVVGDVFGATTHTDLMLRAKKKGIDVKVISNASIMNAIGITGLELYKFGKTTSIVFPDAGWKPETPYNVIKENRSMGLHTLCLLDIKVSEPSREDILKGKADAQPPRFMTVAEGIQVLFDIEKERGEQIFTADTLCIGCARIGSDDFTIIAGTAEELLKKDFGKPLHCLIVPAKLHFVEEEALALWK